MAAWRNRSTLALALLLVPSLASALEVGIDMNRPINNGQPNLAAVPAIAGRESPWVRVEFLLDQWSSPTDTTLHGGRTWFQAYDALVDGYVAQGVQVYGLVGAGATSASGTYDSDAWQTAFVQDALTIVDHFKNRVRVWEVFNEPNNWTSASVPTLDSSPFAHLLARFYQAAKLDRPGDRCIQATKILSGPILGLDVNNGASFLADTYTAGIASWGWGSMATYPLDGAAYHMYFAQGATETDASVNATLTTALGAFWNALQTGEGGTTNKQIYVSEIGWRTSAVSEQQQSDFMQDGFQALDAFGHVPLGIWFSLQDFSATDKWGIFTGPPYDVAHEKPSASTYQTMSETYRNARASAPDYSNSSIPLTMAPGASTSVKVRMVNLGTGTWTAAANYRLGAGPGCPESANSNQLTWSDFSAGGYANNATDARAYLSQDIGPGQTAELDFDLTAPAAPGSYLFAGRMVQDGVTWFGSDFVQQIEVVAAGPDAGTPGMDASAPGLDASNPGMDASTAGLDASAQGIDANSPGMDASGPGIDANSPGMDAGTPGVDASAQGIDASAPGIDANSTEADANPLIEAADAAAQQVGNDAQVAARRADAGTGLEVVGSGGCGCSAGGAPLALLGWLAMGVGWRRRREA